MKRWIQAIGSGQQGSRDLSYEEAVEAAHEMAGGHSTDAQCAAFLMALCMKGEADEELRAFVDVFRSYSLNYHALADSLNCAGPAEGRHLFPITLPVSLLLASVGFSQILHGGDSLPAKQGTAMKELLECLGVEMDVTVKAWETMLVHLHIGFLHTEQLCPPLGKLKQVREQIGLRTVMNIVEKVMNPVHSMNMIIGVNQRTTMESLIPISMSSGLQNVYIVNGIEGSEDLPIYQNSTIRIVTPWGDESRVVEPQKFGFLSDPLLPISKEDQVSIVQRIIAGENSEELRRERDHVIFNTGLRLTWFDKVGSYEEGFQLAESLLQRREAHKVMQKWIDQSRRFTRKDVSNGNDSSTKIG
ncbi:anthranilate phosphoribosyltransferase [Paenibacillus ferrarius]|uniref:Anthranilate phosphoribosyltransferase n=1 Tax=Paenibacillus ferrarius TaxID=1469647 RepID=A0A1V4HB22_9BACL|nr:anthranilate phosphoribosyltransferase [Paenibacillus ferrarius]OPH48566.1 anthranilate phosphoribosyltransferase [Paenibacillus ferrarius]